MEYEHEHLSYSVFSRDSPHVTSHTAIVCPRGLVSVSLALRTLCLPRRNWNALFSHRTQRLREAAASRSFHLKNTGVLRDLAFEPYTFVASASSTISASGGGASKSGTEGGIGDGGSGEEGWDDWGDDDNSQGVRSGDSWRFHLRHVENRAIYESQAYLAVDLVATVCSWAVISDVWTWLLCRFLFFRAGCQ